MNKQLVGLIVIVVVVAAIMAVSQLGSFGGLTAAVGGGFDQFGYNDKARVFTGPADGVDRELDGTVWGDSTYAKDRLVMKWTAGWDRGNADGWSNPPYNDAWLDNEWNGMNGGSASVWHYKIKWVEPPCGADGTALPDGGYCIWGQFDVLMDQGVSFDSGGPVHIMATRSTPNGYGGK